ncbi:DNA polymerase I [Aphelenchoides fujianensis]|nr:DNA polymerase I [Aphelenchoides fujianensis]
MCDLNNNQPRGHEPPPASLFVEDLVEELANRTLNLTLSGLKGCCSSSEMLETFFGNTSTKKFAYDLSATFHSALADLMRSGFLPRNDRFLRNFHCVLTFCRVNLKNCPASFDDLDAQVIDFVMNETKKKIGYEKIRLLGLVRLMRPFVDTPGEADETVAIFNESVVASTYMMFRGFAFSREQMKRLCAYVDKEVRVSEKAAFAIAGQPFNVHNSKATRKILDSLKIRGGKATCTLADLEVLDHPIAPHIIRARRLFNAEQTLQQLTAFVEKDERIHAHFDPLNSCSGRIFAKKPEIQFLPKERILGGVSCRSVFCAAEGHTLLSLDFRQVELRMLAALSGDAFLLEMLAGEGDPFETTAERLTAQFETPFTRALVKKIFYSLVYGMGTNSLAHLLQCNAERAAEVQEAMFGQFDGVRTWINAVTQTALKRGRTTNPWGLSMCVEGWTENTVRRRAPNFVIQSSVAYLVRKAMNEVSEKLDADLGGLVLQMHDEFILEVRTEHADFCADLTKRIMEHEFRGVHFPVRIKRGANWCELE